MKNENDAMVASVPREICGSAPGALGQWDQAPIEEGEKKTYPSCWVVLGSVMKHLLGLAIVDGVGWVGMEYPRITGIGGRTPHGLRRTPQGDGDRAVQKASRMGDGRVTGPRNPRRIIKESKKDQNR